MQESANNHAGFGVLRDRDWRIWLGSIVTVLWLGLGIAHIWSIGGWEAFWKQESDAIGGFLEGFFAPLAFLWLVIGLFMQQSQLKRNTQAMAAAELTERQEAFFNIADNVRRQTGNLVGSLLASTHGSTQTTEQFAQCWRDHASGDYELFPRLLLAEDQLADPNLFFGTRERRNLTELYLESYRRLLDLGRACDRNGTILDTVTQAPHGLVYFAILHHIRAPSAWKLFDLPVARTSTAASIAGRWQMRMVVSPSAKAHWPAQAVGDANWELQLHTQGDRLDGLVTDDRGSSPIRHGTTSGNAILFKAGTTNLGAAPRVYKATVAGNRIRGEIELVEQRLPFEGTRIEKQ